MKTVESKTVRALCIQQEIEHREFARRAGMSASCLSNHLRRGVHDLPARARIENALGVAIWADPDQFTRRAACAKVLGTDPETLREIELRALAAKLPLRPGGSRRAKLIERILDFATANPGFKL